MHPQGNAHHSPPSPEPCVRPHRSCCLGVRGITLIAGVLLERETSWGALRHHAIPRDTPSTHTPPETKFILSPRGAHLSPETHVTPGEAANGSPQACPPWPLRSPHDEHAHTYTRTRIMASPHKPVQHRQTRMLGSSLPMVAQSLEQLLAPGRAVILTGPFTVMQFLDNKRLSAEKQRPDKCLSVACTRHTSPRAPTWAPRCRCPHSPQQPGSCPWPGA